MRERTNMIARIDRLVGFCAVAIVLLGTAVATPGQQQTQQKAVPSFSKDIAPIFQEKCQDCHRSWQHSPDVSIDVQGRAAVRTVNQTKGCDPHYATLVS